MKESYEDFLDDVIYYLPRFLPEEYGNKKIRIKKVNEEDHVVVVLDDRPSPYIRIMPFYNSYKEDISPVLKAIADLWLYSIRFIPEINVTDYRLAKKHIMLQLEAGLNVIPRLQFCRNNLLTWAPIDDNLLSIWGKTMGEVYEVAEINNIKTTEIFEADDLVKELTGIETKDKSNIKVISNKYLFNGAAHILSKEVIKEFSDDNIRIAVPSIHYGIAVKDIPLLDELIKKMYKATDAEDRLSDKLYRYSDGELMPI